MTELVRTAQAPPPDTQDTSVRVPDSTSVMQ